MDDLISRQAAIDAVRELYIQPPKINNDIVYDMAIDQAHDALVNLPSAQHQSSIEKKQMPRYIDADALTLKIDDWRVDLEETYGKNDEYVQCLESVLGMIEDAPTADVVEVVRCKDCSFAEEIDIGLWVCHNPDIKIVGDYVDEDWFCANGTTDLGEWDWNEDPRCADFVCSVCLQRNITCEDRCPHCGVKMRREEKTDDKQ